MLQRMTRVVAGALLLSWNVVAQEQRQAGPPPYDVSHEKIVKAKVVGTDVIEPAPGRQMMYLKVTVDGKPVNVIMAPPDWIKKQNFVFTAGAAADVTGIAGYRLNGEAIMARKIVIGGKTLTLRSDDGKALW